MAARLEGQWKGNSEGPFLAKFGSSGGKAENGKHFKEVGPAGWASKGTWVSNSLMNLIPQALSILQLA